MRGSLASEVRLFSEHVTDPTPVDDVRCSDLMMVLATEAPQPNVDCGILLLFSAPQRY